MIRWNETGVEISDAVIPWGTFPDLVHAHLAYCPDTEATELAGSLFLSEPSTPNAMNLIVRTLYWGGSNGPRILPGVKSNDPEHIRSSLERAAKRLSTGHGLLEVSEALKEINQIKYLGQVSFASKVLRMMASEWVGVLDSIVGAAAGYRLDVPRFALYSIHLQEIARELEARAIPNPRGREGWWAGDCDQALFAFLRGWAPNISSPPTLRLQLGGSKPPPIPPIRTVNWNLTPDEPIPHREQRNLHNVLVAALLGRKGTAVSTREVVAIGVAAGFAPSGVQPGDHSLGGGAPTCACAVNGKHIFINNQPRGSWLVAPNLFWRDGSPAS